MRPRFWMWIQCRDCSNVARPVKVRALLLWLIWFHCQRVRTRKRRVDAALIVLLTRGRGGGGKSAFIDDHGDRQPPTVSQPAADSRSLRSSAVRLHRPADDRWSSSRDGQITKCSKTRVRHSATLLIGRFASWPDSAWVHGERSP